MMQPLDKTLRNRLERTIKDARDIAEDAARAALEQLGVGEAAPFAHLNGQDRELRRCLRAHGRQLGDALNGGKTQTLERLIEEVAYQHWHRMLFARFLAENNLLMYPDPDEPVAITLEECEDLAADEGAPNGWELAARFAARMLPQIFRPDSPVFQLVLPPEHQLKLECLLADLPQEVFTASDSLGWVYQFWQSDNKDKINQSEVKIGAAELPAVTQLFTEPYMVSFLLDNALGAWCATRRLSYLDLLNAGSERELREKAAIPGVPLDYLRFVRQEDGAWTPVAGNFDRWPERLADLKALDPCCGSGHFLVSLFLMLVPMRMELEKLTARDAADAVISQNLHGLELDRRCVEVAVFALAMAAWKYPDAGGYRPLPEMHIACSGLSVSAAKEEWRQLGLGRRNLTIALDWMHDTFKSAPTLGSLINPEKTEASKIVEWQDLSDMLSQALSAEQNEDAREAGVVAHGLAKTATLLAGKYNWIVTNVPYLARGKQHPDLADFCRAHYPEAKNDLATVFLERCLEFCDRTGSVSLVLPQNWLFLTSYRRFREKLLKREQWNLIARLGSGAFETISGEVVKAILISISKGPGVSSGGLFGEGERQLIRGIDVSETKNAVDKAKELISAGIKSVEQERQLENPDARVVFDELGGDLLSNYADSYQGVSPADFPRFGRRFWEGKSIGEWVFWQSTSCITIHYSGNELSLRIDDVEKKVINEGTAYIRGTEAWGKAGIVVSAMRELPCTLYNGQPSDTNAAIIVPQNPEHLPAIWCFCSSPEYNESVRRIDQKLNVTNATLVKVPFDLAHWTRVAEEKYPHGLPKPYTNDPTQWIFHGYPCGSVVWNEESKKTDHGELCQDAGVLLIAVSRLMGYRWPAELDPNMELAPEQREWVDRCAALHPFTDDDGIVCIPAVRGEGAAAERLLNLLAAAYGDAWSNDTLAALLKSADHADKTLETWLREKFFIQHCRLFQNRPFIWHIWDGLRDGFAALVNYHKLDAKLLETLIYTYLGDWISRQRQDIASHVDGARERLAAAEALKKKLELILEGEAPYDIFVRWKPLENQPIGWDPDLNDGVRLNIRPFMTAPDVGRKGAGVLRDKPNIKWDKDRGKDVESAPWYHLGPLYGGKEGDRINDHHLTLAVKRALGEKEKQA